MSALHPVCRSESGQNPHNRYLTIQALHESYKEIETDYTKCIVSQFPHMEEADVCDLLYGIGLSSVPTWLHKPQELSNGERARFEIVKQIANTEEGGVVYIDEYTSVIRSWISVCVITIPTVREA